MTKAQRKARAKRAGAVRRKANAVKAFMRKMNPGKKAPVAVRVKRLKGGGISVTPLKANAGTLSIRKYKKGRLSGYEAATGRAVKWFRAKGSKTRQAKRARRRNIAW